MSILPGISIPREVTDLATRAVEALERIADAAESIDRGQTMARLGKVSRERQAQDRRDDMTAATEDDARCTGLNNCPVHLVRACPVNPTDADLVAHDGDDRAWAGFGEPCNRPLGARGNCAKSLGHSGRCKP